MIIGKRLTAIAELVPDGARLADIGTDHGYLPAYLVQRGKIISAIAGEVNDGPYRSACNMMKRLGLAEAVQVRFGDGLTVLSPGEADTVVIAGVGGATIVEIFSACPAVMKSISYLVVQPMVGGAIVRRWLTDNGWYLDRETLVEEDGKLYEIVAAKQGGAQPLTEIMAEVGPLLWQNKHPLLYQHIEHLIRQKRHVISEMNLSPEACKSPKYTEYTAKIQQLEEMIWQLTQRG